LFRRLGATESMERCVNGHLFHGLKQAVDIDHKLAIR
jgi:hypothetical protein